MDNSVPSYPYVSLVMSSPTGPWCVSDLCYPHAGNEGKQNAQMSIEMNESTQNRADATPGRAGAGVMPVVSLCASEPRVRNPNVHQGSAPQAGRR